PERGEPIERLDPPLPYGVSFLWPRWNEYDGNLVGAVGRATAPSARRRGVHAPPPPRSAAAPMSMPRITGPVVAANAPELRDFLTRCAPVVHETAGSNGRRKGCICPRTIQGIVPGRPTPSSGIVRAAMRTLVAALVLSTATLVSAQTRLAPNGAWVGGTPQLAPNGTWVGGRPQLAPDGAWVGGRPQLAPDGSWVGGGRPQLAPDGSWVGGQPRLAPDGSWHGDAD